MKNPFLGTGVAGHTLFAVLTAMAAWFWPERTLILDAASSDVINARVDGAEQLICVTQLDKIKAALLTAL